VCKQAIKRRKQAIRKVKLHPSHENIQHWKIVWAQTRKTIRNTRRQSWQKFVFSINSQTSLKRDWTVISKISGKRSPVEVKHLQVGNKEITTVADIADTLAESFSEVSSNSHYSTKFLSHKANAKP